MVISTIRFRHVIIAPDTVTRIVDSAVRSGTCRWVGLLAHSYLSIYISSVCDEEKGKGLEKEEKRYHFVSYPLVVIYKLQPLCGWWRKFYIKLHNCGPGGASSTTCGGLAYHWHTAFFLRVIIRAPGNTPYIMFVALLMQHFRFFVTPVVLLK